MKKQTLAKIISISLALGFAAAVPVGAQPLTADASGFYGGLSLRDGGSESQGLAFGKAPTFASRFNASAGDDAASRASLLFGGYRFSNDVAVEASFGSVDKYSLRPSDAAGVRGVGLNLASGGHSLTDVASRNWNVDLTTSWSFRRSFALYGRLGYAQSDVPAPGTPAINLGDPRRLREGMNYGVGLRYDLSQSLGLKVEYARFGRFAGELSTTLPESDQVSVGLQLRF